MWVFLVVDQEFFRRLMNTCRVVCVCSSSQSVLPLFRALTSLDKADVEEFVEVVMECTIVDFDFLLELRRAHLPGVDEPVEDPVPGAVPDCSMHLEVLLKIENTVWRQQILWVLRFPLH